MRKALLIIDVQKSSVKDEGFINKIEQLQQNYAIVFVSRFVNENSPLLRFKVFKGYEDTELAFKPVFHAHVFDKNIYSSYIKEMQNFDEIHLCGADTDACVYKTAMDLMEHNIRPIVLTEYCISENENYHKMGLELLKRNIGTENLK